MFFLDFGSILLIIPHFVLPNISQVTLVPTLKSEILISSISSLSLSVIFKNTFISDTSPCLSLETILYESFNVLRPFSFQSFLSCLNLSFFNSILYLFFSKSSNFSSIVLSSISITGSSGLLILILLSFNL